MMIRTTLNTHTATDYLAGSPYHLEDVLGMDLSERAGNGILTHLLLNQPPICDCHCRRCFMPASRRGACNDALTVDEVRSVIGESARLGVKCIEISGEGEPLLSANLREIIQCASEHGLITTLITNGHALTDVFVAFAYEHNVTLVVSLFSLDAKLYEHDNRLPGSFNRTFESIKSAASLYKNGIVYHENKRIYRMAIHTTAQADNAAEMSAIRTFCDNYDIFLSIAPLAPVGGGAAIEHLGMEESEKADACTMGHNSIILSHSSAQDVGREVCGTCLYGLNIGYDGNLLLDAHAGYELGGLLGNVRTHSIVELVQRQRMFSAQLFSRIDGYCPVRDPKWSEFLGYFLSEIQAHSKTGT